MSNVILAPEYIPMPCLTAEIFGHTIPAPILFAPIGINKLYSPRGELVPAKIAGELGLPASTIIPPPVYFFLIVSRKVLPFHGSIPTNRGRRRSER